ncbi:MAG: YbfB/YjiJ family MFS transporter, partial [Candidatus Eremiobacteraeota bacterium]|nr:YbfB/YjiJ family MFS transporter [Candidatus Eremiobacteraeota bacterium]
TGIASGFAFVLASSIVLDRAARERRPDWVAIFYSGVGAGIVLTGIVVPPLGAFGGWRAGWLGLAAISALLAAVTLPGLTDRADPTKPHEVDPERGASPKLFVWLLLAYGGNGFAYVIPATFMVAMIAATPAVARFAAISWIVVGLVGIPSTVIWNRLGLALGRDRALGIALLVLGFGTVAPIISPNALGVIVAAATLGGTFMGITALASALGRQLFPHGSHVAIGRLTAAFGIGQIVGPALAGVLVAKAGSYAPALVIAACVSCASAGVIFVGSVIASGGFRRRANAS